MGQPANIRHTGDDGCNRARTRAEVSGRWLRNPDDGPAAARAMRVASATGGPQSAGVRRKG
jgi:hypothetical protein